MNRPQPLTWTTRRYPTVAGADLTADAHAAALDLSLVDDRFAPRVLAGEVDQAVRAWAQTIDGSDAPLRALASPAALEEQLHPGDPADQLRVVIRGPHVQSVHIIQLDAHHNPPTMLVELRVSAHRYQEDSTITIITDGDRSTRQTFTARWRMALTHDDTHPWQIVAVDPVSDDTGERTSAGIGVDE